VKRVEGATAAGTGRLAAIGRCLPALAVLAWAHSARGEPGEPPRAMAVDLAEEQYVKGVVVDQTLTFIGHEFFRHFAVSWSEQSGFEKHTLNVRERPSARWGSLISVEQNNREVYTAIVRPTRANIKALAETAAELVARRLTESLVEKAFGQDPDLGPGDF
jgi:curli production assembly/transport component CsgE